MTELSCPRCGARMKPLQRESLTVSPCFSCGGIWLSTSATETLSATLDGVTERTAQEASARAERAMPLKHGGPELRCPECPQVMSRFVIAEVEVDHCPAHGTWFDHGEHERVTAHFREHPVVEVEAEEDPDSSGLELAREPTRGEVRNQVTTPGQQASGAIVAEAMLRAQLIFERDQTERRVEAAERWARWGGHTAFWF